MFVVTDRFDQTDIFCRMNRFIRTNIIYLAELTMRLSSQNNSLVPLRRTRLVNNVNATLWRDSRLNRLTAYVHSAAHHGETFNGVLSVHIE